MWIQLLFIPIIGAFIGWVTNILAIKLIFRPHQPVSIPIINYKIQGLIPKRQNEIATNIGKIVNKELLSLDDVLLKLNHQGIHNHVTESVTRVITEKIYEKIPGVVPNPVKQIIVAVIGDIVQKEMPLMVRKLMLDLTDKMKHEIDFAEMVEERVRGLNLADLERVVLAVASKELRHIEILGAVLGFLIGMVQALWIYFWWSI